MVRAIAGTLVEVGEGRRTAASITALLRGGTRAQAGRTAPAHGLFLVGVDYD
jgi:tRNA pseudouridine38-40 synthase